MLQYTVLPQNDVEKSSDFKSDNNDPLVISENRCGTVLSYVVSSLAVLFSYCLVFFTLPISIWFCFKNLLQWERIVVYRLGKLQEVKGPGNIFIFPWLDDYTKLDLRTKVISFPPKLFLTLDEATAKAGCNVFYRICDPVMYVSQVKDPELAGLKKLAAAICLKHMEQSNVTDLETKEKIPSVHGRIQKELNVITSVWGIEISSVEIEHFHILTAAHSANLLMGMLQQMGISFGTRKVLIPVHGEQSGDFGLKSKNAIKLQSILNGTTGCTKNGAVICFKIDKEPAFYTDFTQGSGKVCENIGDGKVDITLGLPQFVFDSLMNNKATESQLMQAYLAGQVTIEGDVEALTQLQQLLPNFQNI